MTAALGSGTMYRMASDAAAFANRIADLRGDSFVALVPNDVQAADWNHGDRLSWEPFSAVRAETAADLQELTRQLAALEPPPGVHCALEGARRAMLDGRKGSDKFAAAIVHVIGAGEPARVVVLKLAKG